MNTYNIPVEEPIVEPIPIVIPVPIVEPVQEPTLTERAKEFFQQVGEKMGLVQDPTVVPVSSPDHLTGPLAEIKEVRSEIGLPDPEQQKPLTDKAKETFDQMGEKIEPYTEKVKDTLYQAGETLGFVKPVQNIEGPLAEIQDVRQDMGWSRMEQPIQKPLTERAKETWNQAGETIEPYAEKAKESIQQAGVKAQESLQQAGVKAQESLQQAGVKAQESLQQAGVKAQETWNQAGEKIEPYVEKAKETWNQAGETIEPYVEKSKESLYQAGETLGFVKPVQNIEGPLAEIQDVRQDMGWSRMEQPIQKPLTERAKETWNQAGESIEPYAEKAKESIQQAGVKAQESLQQAGVKAQETWNQAGESIEPYTEKAKETWNQAGKTLEPYAEKAKESLYQAGETLGFVKPVQNIEGPLAEIQDVRQEMGWSKMEQPIQKPLTERARETWNQAGESIEPYAEKAKESLQQAGVKAQESLQQAGVKAQETWNQAGERIEPYTEKAKEKLHEAGEHIGLVQNTQNIEAPLVEYTEIQQVPLVVDNEKLSLTKEKIELYAENAGDGLEPVVGEDNEKLSPTKEKIELYAENAGVGLERVVDVEVESVGYTGAQDSGPWGLEEGGKTKFAPQNVLESNTKTLPA